MTYFEDADGEPDPNMLKDYAFGWEEVKSFFVKNIKKFEKSFTRD
jgi:hypothetical protein